MSITVQPNDGAAGAVVTDVDLAALDDATWTEVHDAFLAHGVLVFPGQHLDEAAQGAFARRFGNIEKLYPGQDRATLHFGNVKADGSLTQPDEESFKLLRGNEGWHTDSTYMPLAAKASMLAALVVPPERGGTEFADMRAAYDALDPAMQEQLGGLSAYHSLYHSQAKAGYTHATDHMYGFHDKGAPLRPVIKTHPETGRKSIYTGRHAFAIDGMDAGAATALLDQLLDDACQPPRTYLHAWTVGDLVVWDNRRMMHRAEPYDPRHARVLRASRISGEAESELAPTFADPKAEAFRPTSSNESALTAGAPVREASREKPLDRELYG